jgi:triphosphoribosyl-dephospho-CoA synthase
MEPTESVPLAAGSMSLREQISFACLAEVIAAKPGNVHRGADFEDMTFGDFAVSGIVIADAIASAGSGVGEAILNAVTRTRQFAGTNTNLGIILLLGPLAAVDAPAALRDGVGQVLSQLTPRDSQLVYESIRRAAAGHLGETEQWDVRNQTAPDSLLSAMRSAAERDLVARQYVTNFEDVFTIADWLAEFETAPLTERIVRAHVRAIATWGDTLIARKCGIEIANQAQRLAQNAVQHDPADLSTFWQATADLDFWMRSDGHRRNPGSTADLVCAAVFVALREGRLQPPFFRTSPSTGPS